MKDRRRWNPPNRCFRSGLWRCALPVFLCCVIASFLTFSTFRLFGVSFRPVLASTWQTPALSAISVDGPVFPQFSDTPLHIKQAIAFPDEVLLFLEHPSPISNQENNLRCLYFPPSSHQSNLQLHPISFSDLIVRCPVPPRGFSISISNSPVQVPAIHPQPWDHLSYASLLDTDNTTLVFAKGLNLRPARLSDPSRYGCVFGWDFSKQKYLLSTNAVSVAQEIIRCKTPLSVLNRLHTAKKPPLVSVNVKGRGGFTLPSIAHPEILGRGRRKEYKMCVCTMLRNQAKFLKEWIIYHAQIGVEKWFIYDNNSDDNIKQVIESMSGSPNYNITHRLWPWVKTQEAGFAHCAVHARDSCEWVGFIDVDEFLFFPADMTLHDVLHNYSSRLSVGELRTACHSFGPSGLKNAPKDGVTVGYTCRMGAPERHKSIIRPEALNPSLITIVHHFHLKEGKTFVDVDRGTMVINHYKYQVWEVFKEKFYRRVATYVADWQDEENVGSKDRAPGLGTKAVEPPDWSTRFCEVHDTGLRDWVLRVFTDSNTRQLPW